MVGNTLGSVLSTYWVNFYPYLMEEETEAQGAEVTYPGAPNQ